MAVQPALPGLRRRLRMIVIILLGAVLILIGLPPAPATAETVPKMLLVLDSSGSMKEKSQGEVKIDAAKKALNRTVDSLPPSINVGLRLFGAKVFSRSDKGSCSDSQLVVDVGTDNKAALTAAIKNYRPYGETPISYALEQGAKDLGKTGKRTMVLVSDGESTCKPDPCEIADSLTKQDKDLAIDVIGLNVSGAAKDQLKCVASRGKGSYYDAADADTLANSLQTLAQRSARPFQVTGTPIQGGAGPERAATMTPGEWTDELPPTGPGDARYYRVYRRTLESTLHLSASVNRLGRPDAISLEVRTDDGKVCGTAADLRTDAFGSNLLAAAVSVGGQAGAKPDPSCTTATNLILVVRHADKVQGSSTYGGKQIDQVAIKIIEEAPVTSTSGLPKPASASTFTPSFGGSAKSVTAGSSFADAPRLRQGSFSSTLVPGETQVFLVKEDWGQSAEATLTFPGASGKLATQLGNGEVRANITMFSPTRGSATTNKGGQENVLTKERLVLGTASTPVRYLNRTQPPGKASSYLPGDYAVVVSLSPDPQSQNYVVPYLLHLDLAGKRSGAPAYVRDAPAAPSPPPPAQPRTPSGTAAPKSAPTLPIVFGAVGVLLVAGAVWFVVRRRRQ